MHKQSYSQYFYRVLLDFRKVNIPGLGLFALEHLPAELSLDKQKLNPPSSRIQFNVFEDTRFNISKLLIEAGLDAGLSHGIEKYYEAQAKISQDNDVPFVLEGLGKVIATSFLPDDDSLFNIYDGLEQIKVSPLASGFKNIVHDEEYLYNLAKSQSSKDKSSFTSQFLWPFIIALVTLFVILFWIFSPKPGQINTIQKPIKDEAELVDTSWVEDTITTIDYNNVDTLITALDKEKQEKQTSSNKDLNAVEEINNNLKSEDENCIIIVGAFKNTVNAQRMIKNITQKGYQTFTSEHQGLKRVGVRYNCQNISPEAFKAKMRAQFNNEAWSLSDTI